MNTVQVAESEKACLANCVKGLHGVTESTMHFFRDFEKTSKKERTKLAFELAKEVENERKAEELRQKELLKQAEGFVRM